MRNEQQDYLRSFHENGHATIPNKSKNYLKEEASANFKSALQDILAGRLESEALSKLDKSLDILLSYNKRLENIVNEVCFSAEEVNILTFYNNLQQIKNLPSAINYLKCLAEPLINYIEYQIEPSGDIRLDQYMLEPAEQGHALAQRILGDYYTYEGLQQNLTEAKKWLLKAAEQGNIRAEISLAQMAMFGQGEVGNQRNYKDASKLIQKLVETGQEHLLLKLFQRCSSFLDETPLYSQIFENTKIDLYIRKKLMEPFMNGIRAMSRKDLTDMLLKMKHVITPESFKTDTLPIHIKAYYEQYWPVFEAIASLKDVSKKENGIWSPRYSGEDIFRDAITIREQRKNLFNTIDIFSACGLPAEIIIEIASKLPNGDLPVEWNNTATSVLEKAKLLKGTIPQKQNSTTADGREVQVYTNIEQYESNKALAPEEISPEAYLDNLSKSRQEFFSKSILQRIIEEQSNQKTIER
ncbi:MAG: hcpA 1 [Rickettsiaceae bacterium]|nr:hcpA 1 [Rickettsiaceae bacterium]